MKNIYIKINGLKLVGEKESFVEINIPSLDEREVNLSKGEIDNNLIIDFNELHTFYSLYGDYSPREKIQEVKEICRHFIKNNKFVSAEELAKSVKDTLTLRNSNYQAAVYRTSMLASFK